MTSLGGRHVFRKLFLLIYYEVKRRDPTLASLYALLKEPDDWVRITVARQLLSKKNDAALNVLDTISQQHSEWSGLRKIWPRNGGRESLRREDE